MIASKDYWYSRGYPAHQCPNCGSGFDSGAVIAILDLAPSGFNDDAFGFVPSEPNDLFFKSLPMLADASHEIV